MEAKLSSAGQVQWNAAGAARIADNVRNLMMTRQSEVPFLREMGLPPEVVDAPLPRARGLILEGVMDSVSVYEPRAKVTSIDVTARGGELRTEVVIEL